MDGHPLPVKQLKGEEVVKEIDLSDKKLGVASAVIIAALLEKNTATESLKYASASVEPQILSVATSKRHHPFSFLAAWMATFSKSSSSRVRRL